MLNRWRYCLWACWILFKEMNHRMKMGGKKGGHPVGCFSAAMHTLQKELWNAWQAECMDRKGSDVKVSDVVEAGK